MGSKLSFEEGLMKRYVGIVSILIVLVYSIEGLIFAGLSAWGVIKGIAALPYVGFGTIDGEPTVILDGIGKLLFLLGIGFLAVAFITALAEILILIHNYISANKNYSFRDYSKLSVIALLCGPVNFMLSMIMTFIILIITYFLPYWESLSKFIHVIFAVNVIMEILSLTNMLFSNKLVRDGA
jgi:hypothetical protein